MLCVGQGFVEMCPQPLPPPANTAGKSKNWENLPGKNVA